MKLSLAIINDNAALYLKRFFESLGSWKDLLDIVFVDNCSCDNSIQIAKDLRIRKIVAFEKKEVSRPVLYNAAASRTEGEYVLFTHSDIIFSDGFFKNLDKSLKEKTDLDFMNFRVTYVDKTTIAPSIVYQELEDKRITLSYHSIWSISDPALKKLSSCSESCFLVDSTVFKHEHFDERYFDTLFIEDLLLKLYLQGANIVYDEDSYIEHYFLEEYKRLRTLKYDIRLFTKKNLKELQGWNLIEQDRQISSLETSLQEKVVQINRLEYQINRLEYQINSLEYQIQQIQRSIPMQLVNRYQRVIGKLLRPGTRRRHYYELGPSSIRVILNEGWRSFFRKVKAHLQGRRNRASKQP
jgi:glycosyltransferase involved in cell wall biosynthesis